MTRRHSSSTTGLHSRLAGLAAISLALATAGCSILTPARDTTRFHAFSLPPPVDAPVTPDTAGALVAILPVELADYLRSPRLASRGDDGSLQLDPVHRWAERLDRALERHLAASLEGLEGTRATVLLPGSLAADPDLEVRARLLACEGVRRAGEPLALVAASWEIFDAAAGKVRLTRRAEFLSPWTDADPARLAAALEASAIQLAEALRADLVTVLRTPPPAPAGDGHQNS